MYWGKTTLFQYNFKASCSLQFCLCCMRPWLVIISKKLTLAVLVSYIWCWSRLWAQYWKWCNASSVKFALWEKIHPEWIFRMSTCSPTATLNTFGVKFCSLHLFHLHGLLSLWLWDAYITHNSIQQPASGAFVWCPNLGIWVPSWENSHERPSNRNNDSESQHKL